jgi:hypothetical protein
MQPPAFNRREGIQVLIDRILPTDEARDLVDLMATMASLQHWASQAC